MALALGLCWTDGLLPSLVPCLQLYTRRFDLERSIKFSSPVVKIERPAGELQNPRGRCFVTFISTYLSGVSITQLEGAILRKLSLRCQRHVLSDGPYYDSYCLHVLFSSL